MASGNLTRKEKQDLLAHGPMSWRNWRAHRLRCRRFRHAFEVSIYSDAHFTSQLSNLGPYSVLNTIARTGQRPQAGEMSLALVLRVDQYGRGYLEPRLLDRATSGSYHGGSLSDEFAALLSLALGVRCNAGGIVRRFESTRDRGFPVQHGPQAPVLPRPEWPDRPQLPTVARQVSLDDALPLLKTYSQLASPAATVLVRASRLYQQALWHADGDPYQSWILLVSAVEAAADFHVRHEQSDWSMIQMHWQRLAAALEPVEHSQRMAIASLLAPQIRATRKYRVFLKEFNPPTPGSDSRIRSWGQISWSKTELVNAEAVIYDHRSAALHNGIPFPAPMCEAPGLDEHGQYVERPLGDTTSGDAHWTLRQLPMLLHVYAHIAGEALRAWWRQLPQLNDR